MAKIKIELNEDDIRKIISDKYHVDAKDVELDTHHETQGYGLNESYLTVITAEVTVRYDITDDMTVNYSIKRG